MRELLEIAGSYGIFAALFITLLLYQIKANTETVKRFEQREKDMIERAEKRENKLLDILESYKTTLSEYKFELTKLADAVNKLCEKIDRKG